MQYLSFQYHACENAGRESLANFRWVGPMLMNPTWIEGLLIPRARFVGRVVRLQACNQVSYFGVKGHVILLLQNTTLLLDVLPMTPASLPDVVRVVWTGKSPPIETYSVTVRRDVVYNTLQWLRRHNEDYRQVTIDHEELMTCRATQSACTTCKWNTIQYIAYNSVT